MRIDDGCLAGLRMQLRLLKKLGKLIPGMLKLQYCLTMSSWWQELVPAAMISLNLKGSLKPVRHMVKA